MTRSSLSVGLALVAIVCGGCGDDLFAPFDRLVLVSGAPPFADNCNGRPQGGTNFRGAEVEPHLAIDPGDSDHLLAAWQQDRWSSGGANGLVTALSRDGGRTWARGGAAFSRCQRAAAGSLADYERASDPWVAFTPDGVAFAVALAFDNSSQTARSAILASRSPDGGRTWEAPVELIADNDVDVFSDKESITADPRDPRRVYVVWDRLTGLTRPRQPVGTGPAWFARTDGATWERAKIIYDPGLDAQTIGNQIAVLADGTLLDVFAVLRKNSTNDPSAEAAVIRSTDQGATWSAPISISRMQAMSVRDPGTNVPIRSGIIIPDIEADPARDVVYVAWEDSRFTPGAHNAIVLSRSLDGGRTWSPPALVNGDASAHAFTPALAVSADGRLALSYYDLRGSAVEGLSVSSWLATSRDLGVTWVEERLAGPFELRSALLGNAYFLGDYQGLVATSSGEFVPLLAGALSQGTPTAIFVRPAAPPSVLENAAARYPALTIGPPRPAPPAQPASAAASPPASPFLRPLVEGHPFVFADLGDEAEHGGANGEAPDGAFADERDERDEHDERDPTCPAGR
jgi:hypothetical protein